MVGASPICVKPKPCGGPVKKDCRAQIATPTSHAYPSLRTTNTPRGISNLRRSPDPWSAVRRGSCSGRHGPALAPSSKARDVLGSRARERCRVLGLILDESVVQLFPSGEGPIQGSDDDPLQLGPGEAVGSADQLGEIERGRIAATALEMQPQDPGRQDRGGRRRRPRRNDPAAGAPAASSPRRCRWRPGTPDRAAPAASGGSRPAPAARLPRPPRRRTSRTPSRSHRPRRRPGRSTRSRGALGGGRTTWRQATSRSPERPAGAPPWGLQPVVLRLGAEPAAAHGEPVLEPIESSDAIETALFRRHQREDPVLGEETRLRFPHPGRSLASRLPSSSAARRISRWVSSKERPRRLSSSSLIRSGVRSTSAK